MKLVHILSTFVLFLSTCCWAQSPQRNSYGPASQGAVFAIPNTAGSQAVSFEYLFSATPGAVSITIQGCMRGSSTQPGNVGTCDTATDTYVGTSNSIRSPSFTKVYDTFLITVGTLTGATVTINSTVVVSKAGTSSGGGSGSGTVGPGTTNTLAKFTGSTTVGNSDVTDVSGVITVSNPGVNGQLGLSGSTSGTATITAPAIAGTSTNGVTVSNVWLGPSGTATNPTYGFTAAGGKGMFFSAVQGGVAFSSASRQIAMIVDGSPADTLQLVNGDVLGWGTGSANDDTGISRDAAASIDFGNGAAGNKTALVAFRHANQGATNDYAGVCTGSTTTCSVTFTAAFTSTPACVITPTTSGVTSAIITTQANTGFTVTYAPSAATTFNYICAGNPN